MRKYPTRDGRGAARTRAQSATPSRARRNRSSRTERTSWPLSAARCARRPSSRARERSRGGSTRRRLRSPPSRARRARRRRDRRSWRSPPRWTTTTSSRRGSTATRTTRPRVARRGARARADPTPARALERSSEPNDLKSPRGEKRDVDDQDPDLPLPPSLPRARSQSQDGHHRQRQARQRSPDRPPDDDDVGHARRRGHRRGGESRAPLPAISSLLRFQHLFRSLILSPGRVARRDARVARRARARRSTCRRLLASAPCLPAAIRAADVETDAIRPPSPRPVDRNKNEKKTRRSSSAPTRARRWFASPSRACKRPRRAR